MPTPAAVAVPNGSFPRAWVRLGGATASFAVDDDNSEGTAGFEGHVGHRGELRTGVVVGDEIIDLTSPGIGLPGDMIELLRGGPGSIQRAEEAIADAPG